ncbi:hypothetical protein BDR06DRAFT_977949 [Suillus hirtellus]|nr:hypothetical protein BDR06DRAFT_977949 [Suillus hirtellus]
MTNGLDLGLVLTLESSYFQELGYMLLITQSDVGTENYGNANTQMLLRQHYDPILQGTLQHHWMYMKKNVMPEITWSQLQCRFTPGFKNLLDEGVIEDWYDSVDTLQMYIVLVLWSYALVLPHSIPTLIYHSPEDFGVLDFKVSIDHEGIDCVYNIYIDASNPVFDLAPPMHGNFIKHCYDTMGYPAVTQSSVWTLAENPHPNLLLMTENEGAATCALTLISGHTNLPFNEEPDGMYYMSGVGPLIVWQFLSDELENDGAVDEW